MSTTWKLEILMTRKETKISFASIPLGSVSFKVPKLVSRVKFLPWCYDNAIVSAWEVSRVSWSDEINPVGS